MNRRDFLQICVVAAAAGMGSGWRRALAGEDEALYDIPRYGNVSLLHLTDCHAQLSPIHYREPSINLGVGPARGRPPHLVGDALLEHFAIPRGTRAAHAFTHVAFEEAAQRFGRMGGFAHLATLIKRLRAERPGALLLDGGDTWQGSAIALWTKGADMIEACLALGVDIMTGHWEFTYGAARIHDVIERELKGKIEFLAQNVKTIDFGDPVFKPFVLREVNRVPIAIIGQAFPYTPIAHPRRFVPDWTFGIQEENLQAQVDAARREGARAVVLLSHNGMDVDVKLASRVSGIDVILGGHTHDAVPVPLVVDNRAGQTVVSNAGSNGKFLGVLDLKIGARLQGWRYRLLPVFSDLLPADAAMSELIGRIRQPYEARLGEPLGRTEALLYRRGNFGGTFDQLIVDALREVKDAQIAFSPGFRWGTSLLAGEIITRERLLEQTAITYPQVTLTAMSGEAIKAVLEDVADNLFNPDPYYQQGGDMVRIAGMSYACEPGAKRGQRIHDMRIDGELIDAARRYTVAGWAAVNDAAQGEPVWEVVESWLTSRKVVPLARPVRPRLIGVDDNPGFDPD